MDEQNLKDSINLSSFISEELEAKEIHVNPGELYVVATPIGRVVDISLRAIRVLEEVDLIAAEDTRRSYILLNILGIRKEVISNQKFNEFKKTELFLSALRDGKSIAVISDAGTPCISDPGNELIKRALEEGFTVTPIPGACAAVTALSASGFDLTSFQFCGFFPKENTEKRAEIARYKTHVTRTFVYYESPKRILKTIAFFVQEEIPCRICLCNDLTKTHERFYRGAPSEVLKELEENPNAEKGEFTLIVEIEANAYPENEKEKPSAESLILDLMVKEGISSKEAVEFLSEDDAVPYRKNELKQAALNMKNLFS